MKKIHIFLITLIVMVTVGLRLYKVNAPIADWHSFRQVDTASVARFFVQNGIDLMHPRYHDLSNIQSGKDNPEGWRMVELPVYQGVAAGLARGIPAVSLDVWLRLVTIIAAAGTALLLMLILFQVSSPAVALFAGSIYAILPYSVFFGRTVLPEAFAVFWAVLSVYMAVLATKAPRGSWYIIGAAVAGAVALLVKPTAGFLLLPAPYLIIRHYRVSPRAMLYLSAYALITLLPLLWWRNWIAQFPEGIPVYEWLLNKDNIRFKGAWFHWLFAQRIGELLLGFWGLIPFGIGLLSPGEKREGWLAHVFGFGSLLYLVVFAAGNVQHDYYQILLLPAVSIYTAKGLVWIFSEKRFPVVSRFSVITVCVLFMLAFSWFTIRTYYWINRPEIIEAGTAADRLLPKGAKVIAPYNGDTTFLYQTGRQGWPLGFDIDEKITMGATHYVTVSPTDADFETMELAKKYTVLVRNDRYAIIDLTKPNTAVDR